MEIKTLVLSLLINEFGADIRQRSRVEIVGQIVRLILTPLGHLSGRLPTGNTGGANVGVFRPLPIESELQRIIDGADNRH